MLAIVLAIILDLILGDPYKLPHPIRLMGRIINFEEKISRKYMSNNLLLAGIILVLVNIFMTIFLIIFIYRILDSRLSFVFEVIVYYYCLSARSLAYEAKMVKEALKSSLNEGRYRLSFIVGRDTKNLNYEEIIKATIETVSENTSDGVIAPLFYIFLFGPIGGLVYKFINTMDSMIGYKNDKYKELGFFAARLDDLVNFIPARICGFLMCLASLHSKVISRSIKIMLRDRKNHAGPNPAYPEGAIAGILNIQLGGGHYYGGQFVYKPTIGDDNRSPEIKDIDRTITIMYRTLICFTLLIIIIDLIICPK